MTRNERQDPPIPRDPRAAVPTNDDAGELALAEYDEQLRSLGEVAGGLASTSSVTSPQLTAELAECLDLLERVWPRKSTATAAAQPKRISRFEIERVLGSGGFGIVYLARDPALNRQVALKVPRIHTLVHEPLRERFRREACAAALLDHPNIVPIYENGEDGALCYIAAAYCPGPSLAEWLKNQTKPVPVRLAASLIAQLADAMEYSHRRGVLHRDLKPSNVMLAPTEGDGPRRDEPDLPFTPRLTDFGLAKLRDDGIDCTPSSATLGTPAYVAPEQIGSSSQYAGPAGDIYALGAILYQLLTGRTPFVGDSALDVLDQVRRDEPLAPRRLRREIPRDLETVCLKCLEKSPARRYATACELAADLRRYLRGEPLAARRPGLAVVAGKWIRRQPLAAALLGLVIAVAVTIPAMLVIHNRRLTGLTIELNTALREARVNRRDAEFAKGLADQQRQIAARIAYASTMRLAEIAWRDADIRQCRLLLDTARQSAGVASPPGIEWHALDRRTRAESRPVGEAHGALFCLGVSPDGGRLALGGERGLVQIVEIASGTTIRELQTTFSDVRSVAYNQAGDRLAACGESSTVSVWELRHGQCVATSPAAPATVRYVVWLGAEPVLAAVGDFPGLQLWNLDAPEHWSQLDTGDERITSIDVSADGRMLATGGADGNLRLWDVASRKLLHAVRHGPRKITAVDFSLDGIFLAVGDNDRRVRVYGCGDGALRESAEVRLTDDVRSLAFSPRQNELAVLEQFGTLRMLDWPESRTAGVEPLRCRHGWLAHEERGSQLAFAGNDGWLVTVGRDDQRAKRWTMNGTPTEVTLLGGEAEFATGVQVLFAPDASRLFVAARGIHEWSTGPLAEHALRGEPTRLRNCLAITRDGRWLAAGVDNLGVVELWDRERDEMRQVACLGADCLAFSPDGRWLAAGNWQNDVVELIEVESGQAGQRLAARQNHAVAFSADGKWLAADDLDNVLIWDTAGWQLRARLKGHLSTILSLEFSPDGSWLASAGRDREIRLWDTTTWKLARRMSGHRGDIKAVRWAGDEQRLVTLDALDFVKIWDPATGLEVGNLRVPSDGTSEQLAIAPEARYLAIRTRGGPMILQRLRDGTTR